MSNNSLTRRQAAFIVSHSNDLRDLPEPSKEWSAGDVNLRKGMIQKLNRLDIICRVSRDGSDKRNSVWTTDQKCYERIQQY